MTLVLDASVVIAWLLGETQQAEDCIRQSQREGALAPSFWPYEIANAIAMAARRKRIKPADRAGLLRLMSELDIEYEWPRSLAELSEIDAINRKHGLTAYDAAYLLLAQRRDAVLASLDGDLRAAAKKERVALLPA